MFTLKWNFWFFIALCIFSTGILLAQTTPVKVKHSRILITSDTIYEAKEDTVILLPEGIEYKIKRDKVLRSERFYRNLKRRAYKNKWSGLLYDVMTVEFDTTDYHHHTVDDFLKYEGLEINSISYNQVDVWTGSVIDTSYSSSNWFTDFSNKTHYGTRQQVIKNNLLFKIGEKASAYHFSDNERILRQLPYLEDARIYVVKNASDELDVKVVTKDLYSYGVRLDMHGLDEIDWRLFDRNFLGYGNTFSHAFITATNENPRYGYEGFLSQNNIRGSFVNILLLYRDAYDRKWTRFKVNKEFITPEIQWGGAFDTYFVNSQDSLYRGTDSLQFLPYRRGGNNFWLGHSFNLGKEVSRDNLTFITSFDQLNYFMKPNSDLIQKQHYVGELFTLSSVVYTHRGYVKDRMVNRFGITEDIPVGFMIGVNRGYAWKEFYESSYLGFESRFSYVSNSKYGFAVDFRGGMSKRNELYEDKVVKTNVELFSPLFCVGKMKYRVFLKGGYHRATHIFENTRTKIGDGIGVRGLNDLDSDAHSRFFINYDQVVFTPWYVGGFKFAPYVFADGAYLRSRGINELFTGYGLGFRLRNESLVIRTIHFRFGYHPQISNLLHNRYSFSFSLEDALNFLDIRARKPSRVRMN